MRKKITDRFRWVLFVAARSLARRRNKSSTSTLLSILEIGAGVLALTVIIAVMNGFQLGFIENILEISSYYIRVDKFPKEKIEVINQLKTVPGVISVVPFVETQGILQGNSGGQCVGLLRGLPQSAITEDAGMRNHLEFVRGGFNLVDKNAVLLGVELAARLGAGINDKIDFLSISNLFTLDEDSGRTEFIVTGIFRTGYYEYDSSWGFINIQDADAIEGGKNMWTIGIKLKDRYQDTAAAQRITRLINKILPADIIETSNVQVSSWRDYNKSFFNALRTEKLLMFVLVGLIFIVVALNIYQSQRRTVLERSEEIGLLRAVGASDFSVRWVFALKGLLIGILGATGGMALALIIATHIQGFFSLIETIVTFIIQLIYSIRSGLWINDRDFAVFSKRIFYIREYTARLIFHEVVFIYIFAVLSAFLAAWFASKRIIKIKPSEVLRNE